MVRQYRYPYTGIDYDRFFSQSKVAQLQQLPPEKRGIATNDRTAPPGAISKPTSFAYRFKVATGGGTYITQAATVEDAERELLTKYPAVLSIERANSTEKLKR